MTTKQGEYKYGRYVPASTEEAHEIWKARNEIIDKQRDFIKQAGGICKCCFTITNEKSGQIHHRNGDTEDYSLTNLIWLCMRCYNQVNGIKAPTIASLQAELT